MSHFIRQTQSDNQLTLGSALFPFWGFFLYVCQCLKQADVLFEEPAPDAQKRSFIFSTWSQLVELIFPRREMVFVEATQSRLLGKGSRKYSYFRFQA